VAAAMVSSPGSISLVFFMAVALALALVAVARTRFPRAAVPLIALLAVTLPQIPLRPSPDEGLFPVRLAIPGAGGYYTGGISFELTEWISLALFAAVLWLAYWAVRSRWQLELLVGAVLVTSLYPIGDAIKQYAAGDLLVRPGQSNEFAAVRGPFNHPNVLAFYLLVIIAIALVMFLEARMLNLRVALGGFLFLATACLLLTYTRSAWIGLAAVMLLLGLIQYRKLLIVGLVLLALAALAFPGAANKVEQRFGDLSTSSQAHAQSSWAWRTGQWRRMIHWGWKKPILGQGLGSYERLTVKEFGFEDPTYQVVDTADPGGHPLGISAHNDYLKMFVETGLVGLALWLATLIGLTVSAARSRRVVEARAPATAMLSVMIALLVVSSADTVQGYTVILVTVSALIGGAAGVAARASRPGARPAGRA